MFEPVTEVAYTNGLLVFTTSRLLCCETCPSSQYRFIHNLVASGYCRKHPKHCISSKGGETCTLDSVQAVFSYIQVRSDKASVEALYCHWTVSRLWRPQRMCSADPGIYEQASPDSYPCTLRMVSDRCPGVQKRQFAIFGSAGGAFAICLTASAPQTPAAAHASRRLSRLQYYSRH